MAAPEDAVFADADGYLDVVSCCEVKIQVGFCLLESWRFTKRHRDDRSFSTAPGPPAMDVLTCKERDGLGVIWYENRQ